MLMSNILLLFFFLVFCVVVFALYQVVPVAWWTNRIWQKSLYKHTMYVMGIYQSVWRETHYDVTDGKNNVQVEGLNIHYH